MLSSVNDLARFPWLRCFLVRGRPPRLSVGPCWLDLAKELAYRANAWHLGVGSRARRFGARPQVAARVQPDAG